MNGWVSDALTDGTNYFWFEVFDEPWKIQFDTLGQHREDHWGLMDASRNLKDGVAIPDCGGKTVSRVAKGDRLGELLSMDLMFGVLEGGDNSIVQNITMR